MDQIVNTEVAKPKYPSLCSAQWLVIEREILKLMGFLLVTTGVLSSESASQFVHALEMLIGSALIIRPIIYQIYRNSITQRIKEVSELPNVKGVVTDPQTANVTLASELKVVSNPDQLKGVTT